jgi:hypothetical protein
LELLNETIVDEYLQAIHQRTPQEVFEHFGTSPSGLSVNDVAMRLGRFGKNIVSSESSWQWLALILKHLLEAIAAIGLFFLCAVSGRLDVRHGTGWDESPLSVGHWDYIGVDCIDADRELNWPAFTLSLRT